MKALFSSILILFSVISFGQDYAGIQICIALQSNGFTSEVEAEEALDLIMDASGLNKNFVLVPCEKIKNAYAIRYNNERYILYDKKFMDGISGAAKWRNLTILAHEVAHHLNNHPLEVKLSKTATQKSYSEKRRQELEADEFAGFIMARLDAPLNEAIKAISSISTNNDDTYSTHPSRDKRIKAIENGYSRVSRKESTSWFNWETPDFIKKLQKILFEDEKSETEEVEEVNTSETESQVEIPRETYKMNTTDFYVMRFKKLPDYGNYIDVNSTYFTDDILYSRTTEVLNAHKNKRYGKLHEGLSYVNRSIQLSNVPSYVDYDNRAELNFYLGNYQEALEDINKSIGLLNYNDTSNYGDRWSIKHSLKLRSQIKYMLGDIEGAIKDINEHLLYFEKRDGNCSIVDYYWLFIYYLAIDDDSSAKFYLEKINSYPNEKWGCGEGGTITDLKLKASQLTSYLKS